MRFNGARQKLSKKRALVFCIVIATISILKYGLGYVRYDTYRQFAANPFTNLPIQSNYLQASPLTPLIAYYLNLTSKYPFAILLIGFLLIAWLLFFVFSIRRLGSKYGLALVAVMFSHPLMVVLQSWIGMPDSISFFLIVVVIFAKDWRLLFLISIFGALNHPSMYFALPAILVLRSMCSKREINRSQIIVCIIGLIVGLLLTRMYLGVHEIRLESRAEYIWTRDFSFWLDMNLNQLPYLLFSLNGPAWLAIWVIIYQFYRSDKRFFITYLGIAGAALVVTFFTLDNTRVFGLLTIGPSMILMVRTFELIEERMNKSLEHSFQVFFLMYIVIMLAFPNYYAWEGRIQVSNFSGFYRGLLSRMGQILMPVQ